MLFSANPVTQIAHPLRLNVGFIAHESVGYSRDFHLSIPNILIDENISLHTLAGVVRVSRATQGLLVKGDLLAIAAMECSRCLEPFDQQLHAEFLELYTFASHATRETELIYPESGIINLTPLVHDYMLLDIPINPICSVDCKGLCPICGENLNLHPDHHHTEVIDPRLEILKRLLDE